MDITKLNDEELEKEFLSILKERNYRLKKKKEMEAELEIDCRLDQEEKRQNKLADETEEAREEDL